MSTYIPGAKKVRARSGESSTA